MARHCFSFILLSQNLINLYADIIIFFLHTAEYLRHLSALGAKTTTNLLTIIFPVLLFYYNSLGIHHFVHNLRILDQTSDVQCQQKLVIPALSRLHKFYSLHTSKNLSQISTLLQTFRIHFFLLWQSLLALGECKMKM